MDQFADFPSRQSLQRGLAGNASPFTSTKLPRWLNAESEYQWVSQARMCHRDAGPFLVLSGANQLRLVNRLYVGLGAASGGF